MSLATPLYVEVESGGVIAIKDAQGCDICRVWDDGPEWLDNAERLVRWVNASTELLAASNLVLKMASAPDRCGACNVDADSMVRLRAAIAKATKEHP